MHCTNCGAPLDPAARFCDKCGNAVAPAPGVPGAPQAVTTALSIFRNKKIIIIIVVAAIIAIAAATGGVHCEVRIGGKDKVEFGEDYKSEDGKWSIVNQKTKFDRDDRFAFIITLKRAIGAPKVDLVISKVLTDGGEKVVASKTHDVGDPKFNVFSQRFDNLYFLFPHGSGSGRKIKSSPKALSSTTTAMNREY